MELYQLEHIIRAAAKILERRRFIVVGSQSILGAHPDAPPELKLSHEADLYPPDAPGEADVLTAVLGEGSAFHASFGVYADGVSERTSTLPDGWRERLVEIRSEGTRGASAWCLDPTDLAIAKHVAGRPKDIAFTAVMVENGMIDPGAFASRLDTVDIDEADRRRIRQRFEGQLRRYGGGGGGGGPSP